MARPPRLPDATILQLIEELRAQQAVLTGTRLRQELQARHGVRGGVTRLYRLLHQATQPQPARPLIHPLPSPLTLPNCRPDSRRRSNARASPNTASKSTKTAGPSRSTGCASRSTLWAMPRTDCAYSNRTYSIAHASRLCPPAHRRPRSPPTLARAARCDRSKRFRNLVT